jgi:ketosteroid isomerase-like protein
VTIDELLDAYGEGWAAADFGAVASCWDADDTGPVYLGIEYPAPLVGWSELNKHWGRLAARVRAARVRWEDVHVTSLGGDLATVVALSTWEIEGEPGTRHVAQTWVSALVRRRPAGWRIAQYVETPAYFPTADPEDLP